MRLIDADALESHMNNRLSWLVKEYGRHDHYTSGYGDGVCAVEDAPTIDAVEVVRCKDCVWCEQGKSYEPYCNHPTDGMCDVQRDDFCSYGERRSENV